MTTDSEIELSHRADADDLHHAGCRHPVRRHREPLGSCSELTTVTRRTVIPQYEEPDHDDRV